MALPSSVDPIFLGKIAPEAADPWGEFRDRLLREILSSKSPSPPKPTPKAPVTVWDRLNGEDEL